MESKRFIFRGSHVNLQTYNMLVSKILYFASVFCSKLTTSRGWLDVHVFIVEGGVLR